jgi:hypothetical protein
LAPPRGAPLQRAAASSLERCRYGDAAAKTRTASRASRSTTPSVGESKKRISAGCDDNDVRDNERAAACSRLGLVAIELLRIRRHRCVLHSCFAAAWSHAQPPDARILQTRLARRTTRERTCPLRRQHAAAVQHHAPQALKQAMHSQRLKRLRVAGPMPGVHGPGRPAAVPACHARSALLSISFTYGRIYVYGRTPQPRALPGLSCRG